MTGKTADAEGGGIKMNLKLSFCVITIALNTIIGLKSILGGSFEKLGGGGRGGAEHLVAVGVD